MTSGNVVYRITYPNGETCHTGYQALAHVWLKHSWGAVLTKINPETPPEQRTITRKWMLLPMLRRLSSDFQSHPMSRGISDCEEAGVAMAEAAREIERLREQIRPLVDQQSPVGYLVDWPSTRGKKPGYFHGPKRPSYGAELDALCTLRPVFNHPSSPQATCWVPVDAKGRADWNNVAWDDEDCNSLTADWTWTLAMVFIAAEP